MSAFAKLKANRQAETAKLQDRVKNGDKKTYDEDARYWRPKLDPKTKTGAAIIRFMPASEHDDAPFVTLYEHAFNRNGGWYIEKSRSTLGKNEADPVLEYNEKLWKSGNPKDKLLVSGDPNNNIAGSKRKKYFIANIYVVKHDAAPEDEGKVFLFKFGAKVKKMIDDLLVPEDEGEDVIDVTDFWEGANFSFKAGRQGGFANYDASKFLKQSALLNGDDEALEGVYHQLYSLKAEIAPDKFKSYEELSKQLTRCLGGVAQAAQAVRSNNDSGEDEGFEDSRPTNRQQPNRAKPSFNDDEDDDAFFSRMKSGNSSSDDDEDQIPF